MPGAFLHDLHFLLFPGVSLAGTFVVPQCLTVTPKVSSLSPALLELPSSLPPSNLTVRLKGPGC